MHYKEYGIKGISITQGYEQLPNTPLLLERLYFIPEATKEKYISKREERIALKTKPTSVDSRLREYQNQDVGFLMSLKNKAIFNQQRTGKTPTSLVTMRELKETNAVFIVPNSTLYTWQTEYKKWINDNVTVINSEIPKKKRKEIIENFKGTIITTYGIATNDFEYFKKRKPETLLIDECHRLRNYKGMKSSSSPKLAKAIVKLGREVKQRYALSGTPAPNKAYHIYGTLAFLYPNLFKSYWGFVEYYFDIDEKIINRDLDTRKMVGGFRSKEKQKELQQFLEGISVQRKRVDVMKWVNEIEPRKILLPPTKKQIKYEEQMKEMYETEHVEALNDLDRLTKQRQIILNPEMLGLKDKGAKLKWVKDYLEDYPEKSIIFVSMFTSLLKRMKEEIKGAELLIGDTSDANRERLEESFNKKETKILLANIDVAKEGMKLYGADTLVFLDRSLTVEDNNQMMDRLIPISEAIAKDKDPQDIIILQVDLYTEHYLDKMATDNATLTEIINNYGRTLHD